MSNAQIVHYARSRGLPPPLFEWAPRFKDLPNELRDIIVAHSDYHVTSRHRNSNSSAGLLEEMSNELHPFNILASTCQGMRDVVEHHCKLLFKNELGDHAVPNLDEAQPHETYRGHWLRYISDRCAFCKDTSGAVLARAMNEETAMNAHVALGPRGYRLTHSLEQASEYTRARSVMHRNRLRTLSGSPFRHEILCCGLCEYQQWPNAVEMEMAARNFGLDLYFLLFPIFPLQIGRRKLSYVAEEKRLKRADPGMGPSIEEVSRGKRDMTRTNGESHDRFWGVATVVLEEEVEALRQAVVARRLEVVPAWMTRWPGCVEDVLVDHMKKLDLR